jgi:Holliday junction resolvase
MAKQTENQIQSAIREYLQYKGWFVVRHQQGLGCHRGLSDLTAIKNGRVIWIEVKTPNGKLSEYQKKFKEEISIHGGTYIVARSIDDVKEIG